jgi:hypothetical protein
MASACEQRIFVALSLAMGMISDSIRSGACDEAVIQLIQLISDINIR